jgi:hypothetical protein
MDEIEPNDIPDRNARADRSGEPGGAGVPRWVKAFIAIGVVLAVLVVVALLTGHGPGRHMRHGIGQHPGPGTAGQPR